MDSAGSSTTSEQDQIAKFIQDGGLDFLKEVEANFDCASACTVPMAYTTLDISLGAPVQDCANAIIDKLTGSAQPAGIVSIVTGLVLLTAMCGVFPLCKGFDEDENDK